jgi:CDP-4-dehydro-6-deoxyglucose reductase
MSCDVTPLQVRQDPPAPPGAARRFAATVLRLDRLAEDVTGLALSPTGNSTFLYRPGQYLSVLLADGYRRSFSMASACGVDRPIELHIRRRMGGRFSDTALAALKIGDSLSFEGPFGHVDWRKGAGPVILMGTGTGLAPLKALLEHGLGEGGQRQIHLYWGGRAPADLYLSAQLRKLAAEHARFRFNPLVSGPHPAWVGRRCYVQDAVAEDFPDLHGAQIYACGSGAMIKAARTRLAQLPGFHDDRFLSDAFEPAEPAACSAELQSVRLSLSTRGTLRYLRARPGTTLLSALRVAGAPIPSVCGGNAACGTCKITVAEVWRERLPVPKRTEQRLLDHLERTGPGDRLACQIQLTRETDGLAVSLVPEVMAPEPVAPESA